MDFMKRTIKILPEHLANKIAAGEVIQRPASAVKELMENSLDANAKSIQVIIKNGGIDLIQVVDDGKGMMRDDAEVAFLRHATSKIETYEDLESIRTLGFRGEALASIAAVSQVEMRTRQAGNDVGTLVRISGNSQIEIADESCAIGTTILMRNLFFNTPARRHFLKSTATEYRHIYDVVQKCAISNPEVEFQFFSDDESIVHFRSCVLPDRIKDIFGESLTTTLMPVDSTTEPISISGFIGQPQFARRGKAEQFIFLNKRFIISKNLNHAVYQAYEHLIEKGSFPFFIIFISIDPRKVDVNVHPTKMEVKFEDESSIYKLLLTVIRSTLAQYDLVPQIQLVSKESEKPNITDSFRLASQPVQPRRFNDKNESMQSELPKTKDVYPAMESIFNGNIDAQSRIGQVSASNSLKELRQLRNKYILSQSEEGILIIDQHAAHERIIYEKVRSRFVHKEKVSQQLLFPITIELTPGDSKLVKELEQEFEMLGFSLKYFGNHTIIIDGVPPEIKAGTEGSILQDVLSLYKDDKQEVSMKPSERLAKTFACKAAVKAGDVLSQSEMISLIEQLANADVPNVCPHGRPVSMKLTIEELDRRFGRTS
jgi:DNA mismatch repair protein MutL